MEFSIVPSEIKIGEESPYQVYSGFIKMRPPLYIERTRLMNELLSVLKIENVRDLSEGINERPIDYAIYMMEELKKYILEVNLINTETNISYKSLDDIQSDSDLDDLVQNLCAKILSGVSLGKSKKMQ
jgi:hypothetical protein